MIFRSENEDLAEELRKAILLSSFKVKCSMDTLSNFSLPKRRFYVILNPYSGRRKALKIFKKVQQIFYEAEIGYKLVQTTHAVSYLFRNLFKKLEKIESQNGEKSKNIKKYRKMLKNPKMFKKSKNV